LTEDISFIGEAFKKMGISNEKYFTLAEKYVEVKKVDSLNGKLIL
jgi:hypothetical protein